MRKRQKAPLMVLIVLGIVTVILASIYIVKINGPGYDIEDIFQVEILGTENYGYAKVEINPEFFAKTGILAEEFKYTVSKENMLSNGDVITITVEEAEKLKVRLNKPEMTFKVSGLVKGTDLDIFKDLKISYDSEKKKIILDNSECSEFIKENVLFSVRYEKQEYMAGDQVEIVGYVDMNAATDNRYNISNTIYKYIVR